MTLTQRDRQILKYAENLSVFSKARRLKVGAVIMSYDRLISQGINHHPDGLPCESLVDGQLVTDPKVIHAEVSAINKAIATGENLQGSTIYVTHQPCPACAEAIVKSGIRRVVYAHPYRIADGLRILLAAGVKISQLIE